LGYYLMQQILNVDDVHKVAVSIEFGPFQLQFEAVVMRMPEILRAPVSPNQEVLGHKVALNGEGVHESVLSGGEWTLIFQ
jgi:hypothetical protein